MAAINEGHMHHEGPTDVITFDYSEPPTRALLTPSPPRPGRGIKGEVSIPDSEHATRNTQHAGHQPSTINYQLALHGEVFICVGIAVVQAREFRTTWQSEIVRYLVHSLLHLCGYDDLNPTARREMKRHENRLVRNLENHFAFTNISRPT